MPAEFRLRVGEVMSASCANGNVTTTNTSFAVCELSASLVPGLYPLAAALDETSFTSCAASAFVDPAATVCEMHAWLTPVAPLAQSGGALTSVPLLLQVDTARLIANGTLDSACASLRVLPFDLTRELDIWVESATCGTERTLIWVRDPLGGPLTGPSEPYAQFYVAHGDPDAAAMSDPHVVLDVAPMVWLSARDPRLIDGQPVGTWLDLYGTGAHAAGACGGGEQRCEAGVWGACEQQLPQPEICDDLLDNDCDGLIDSEDTDDCSSEAARSSCGCTAREPPAPWLFVLALLALTRRCLRATRRAEPRAAAIARRVDS